MEVSTHRRIARNSIALYVRMLISLVVSLYVSRVVLNALGVSDYGIVGAVGAIVAAFSFINASMSGATSRFITVEMKPGNDEKLRDTFNTALAIHVALALVVLVASETIGLWLLTHKLVIPDGRMAAAHIVFQASVATAMLTITQVPYNATIIAHEHMSVYAVVEIVRAALLLAVAWAVKWSGGDRLVLYVLLLLAVTAVVLFIYRIYCVRHYPETHLRRVRGGDAFKPMLRFLGWDLYGNGCVALHHQGVTLLINMFFGVVYNASATIATQVNTALQQLTKAVVDAFRPQIVKQYAAGEFTAVSELMCNAVRCSVLLMGLMAVPCLLEMDYILSLWLGTVPPLAATFCQLLIGVSLIGIVNSITIIAIHATGRVKLLSVLSGSLYLVAIVIIYVCYKLHMSIVAAYVIQLCAIVVILVTNFAILRHLVPQVKIRSLIMALLESIAVVVLAAIVSYGVHAAVESSLWRLVLVVVVNTAVIAAFARNMVKELISKR